MHKFLDLGFTPPADAFLRKEQLHEPETYYPLEVMLCQNCGFIQLSHIVSPEVLYRHDYPYESSMTRSGQLHWNEFARTVTQRFSLGPDDLVVDIGSNVRDDQLVILSTGSQGEPRSALNRMASGEHKQVQVHAGDTIIVSGGTIPGNEEDVGRMLNNLFARGANVIYGRLATVHVSGHGSRDEMQAMLQAARPKFLLPVHGEPRHLHLHARLAEEAGMSPDNVFILYERGEAYRMLDRFDKALADFSRALKLRPELADVLRSRGETYRLLERYDEALADLTRSLELEPDNEFALSVRGATYRRLGRYKGALTDLNRAVKLAPKDTFDLYERGEAYRMLERYDKALVDFTRVLKLDPERADALRSRGDTHRLLGNSDEALADLP